MKKTAFILLTLALLLCLCPAFAAGTGATSGHDSFTGIVTYRSGKEAYLQGGDRGLVALLDSSNAQADLDAVQVGKRVTVTGEAMTMNRSGYHIPEIVDAMIVEVKDTEMTVEPTPATTGRPWACCRVTSSTWSFSLSLRVGVSPVGPSGTRKSIPVSTCQSTVAAKAS